MLVRLSGRGSSASRVIRCAVCVMVAQGVLSPALSAGTFDTRAASFELRMLGESAAYRDRALFVMPGDAVDLEIVHGPSGSYSVTTRSGVAAPHRSDRTWRWIAPDHPGTYQLEIKGPGGDTVDVHAFVMVPATQVKNGLLNGYRIGQYPPRPPNGNAGFLPPRGFVEVTKDNQDTKLTPHFRLRQFLCKEDTTRTFPKYVVVRERLALKLEAVVELVNSLGFHADTLNVMSAYRTPFYNHAIGDVLYSQHQWGSAADIFVDSEHQNRMDDLNRDGRVDVADAAFLYNAIERMLAEPDFHRFEGGMGWYPATGAHPPFVHVDVRGAHARWQG